jgi:hypothetical protein
MTKLLLLLLLLAPLVCACARPAALGPGFAELSGHFAQAVRWQDFQGAAKFVAEDQRETFLEQFPRNKDLHMVDVRYERIALDEAGGAAETVLFVEYYLLPSPALREWRWTQQWRRLDGEFPKGAPWQIQASPPAFP